MYTRSGKNQNDFSTYTIIKLHFEQADEQADEQANEQADEYNKTKLNLLFNYIYKKINGNLIGLNGNDREPLITNLKRLELYTEDTNAYIMMTHERFLDAQIMMWAVKELYLSPYKMLLSKLDAKNLRLKYTKTKKYITEKENYRIDELISYFITCLQEEMQK